MRVKYISTVAGARRIQLNLSKFYHLKYRRQIKLSQMRFDLDCKFFSMHKLHVRIEFRSILNDHSQNVHIFFAESIEQRKNQIKITLFFFKCVFWYLLTATLHHRMKPPVFVDLFAAKPPQEKPGGKKICCFFVKLAAFSTR